MSFITDTSFLNSSLDTLLVSTSATPLSLAAPSAAFCHHPTQAHSQPPPTHTLPAPSLPHLLPFRLGSNSTCKWCWRLIVTFLMHQMSSAIQNSACCAKDEHITVSYSDVSMDKKLSMWCTVLNAMNCLQMLSESRLLPLPGVSNAVGCGCVSDCSRLWGCGPGFREWGFL